MLQKALPIWAKGYEKEWNTHVVFSTEGDFPKDTTLHLAGTAYYRVYLNGEFAGAGPARTAKGYLAAKKRRPKSVFRRRPRAQNFPPPPPWLRPEELVCTPPPEEEPVSFGLARRDT